MKSKYNSECLLQDGSVFLGLTSLPLEEKDEEKFVAVIRNFFKSQKDKLLGKAAIISDKDWLRQLDEKFYQPRFYQMFGKFDLLSICLVEGFNFPVRQFNSYNFYESLSQEKNRKSNDREGFKPFSRHSILGPLPRFDPESSVVSTCKEFFGPGSLSQTPLIGLVQLKIDDFFLLECGVEFVRACLKYIRFKLKSLDAYKNSDLNFLLIENYGWSELTLVIYSNSFFEIQQVITHQIRPITLKDVLEFLKPHDDQLYDSISFATKEFSPKEVIFIDSYSQFGFDYEVFNEGTAANALSLLKENDKFSPVIEWIIRPGQYTQLLNKVSDIFDSLKGSLTAEASELLSKNVEDVFNRSIIETRPTVGKTDLFTVFNKPVSALEIILFVVAIRKSDGIKNILIETATSLSFDNKQITNETLSGANGYTAKSAQLKENKLIFNSQELRALRKELKSLLIPHTTQEATLNLYSTFNDHVLDLFSFASYIEMGHFLWNLKNSIHLEYKRVVESNNDYSSRNLTKTLNIGIHAFHHAYNNRVSGNYANVDQYDSLRFLSFGAHSLVSALDVVYKNICTVLGDSSSFVFIEADHEFTISNFALRINYFHIFNPELLCAVIFQEAANQCQLRFNDQYPDIFMFHRKSDFDNLTYNIDIILNKSHKTTKADIYKYKELLQFLTPEFFEHIFSDLTGYRTFYENNPKLYTYWSWVYFVTDPMHFKRTAEGVVINESKFLGILLRQYLVLMVFEKDFIKTYKPNFDEELDSLFEDSKDLVLEFLNRFFTTGPFADWLQLVKNFVENLQQKVLDNSNIPDSLEDEIMNDLNEGRVHIYKKPDIANHEWDVFSLTKVTLRAYLKVMMEKAESFKGRNLKVYRGSFLNTRKSDYSGFLFDSLGGTYLIDAKLRREVYRIRSSFHMSLIDISLKEKGFIYSTLLDKLSSDELVLDVSD